MGGGEPPRRRALFALPREGGTEEEEGLGGWDDSQGYEALREFSSGVQVVAPSQQDEFFAKPNGDGALGGVGPGGPIDPLPTAEFVRFNAAGLQAILARGASTAGTCGAPRPPRERSSAPRRTSC